MKAFDRVKSGVDSLDKVIDNIRIGDNVVWQVDNIDDYAYFVNKFVEAAQEEKKEIIYIRFADYPPIIKGEGIKTYTISANEGFESFTGDIHQIIEEEGLFAYYVFDSLSYIVEAWATDSMLGNFFYVTCPYLFELDTIAFFAIIRNNHSFKTIAKIRDTTQILINVYNCEGELHLHPIKVWKRHSPTMFLPHIMKNDKFLPITKSADITEFFNKLNEGNYEDARRKLDFWDKIFLEASSKYEKGEISKETENKLCKLIIGREKEILELADRYLKLKDLLEIKSRLIGSGFIGGKAVGMVLARKILQNDEIDFYNEHIEPHDSFFIGSDIFYTYLIDNGCWKLRMKQKKEEYYFEVAEELREKISKGKFSDEIREDFKEMLEYFGQSPIIVRSSSLLEDGFGNAFAGKYESVFCVNQGTPEDRYRDFEKAVKTVFASTMSKEALAYRKQRGLDDKDEQMALLVQRVSGDYYGDYFFPEMAGVGVSYNMYVWNKEMKPEAGMIRLVFGLGTRAVDRVEDDYPRLIAVDNPLAQPVGGLEDARNHSQKHVDLLNIINNSTETVEFNELIAKVNYKGLDLVAQKDYETTSKLRAMGINGREHYLITFDKLLKETKFVNQLEKILKTLEEKYNNPVDIEFTANFNDNLIPKINIVQCRPLQTIGVSVNNKIPENIPSEKIFFKTQGRFMGSNSRQKIDRIIYVDAKEYTRLTQSKKYEVARTIGILNRKISSQEEFKTMLIGPGRWGTSTPSLGVPVSFSEINKISVLVEMAYNNEGIIPDISFGSHFFQDLVESNIFYVALFPDEKESIFNIDILKNQQNMLEKIVADKGALDEIIKVYDVEEVDFIADIFNQELVCSFEDIDLQ